MLVYFVLATIESQIYQNNDSIELKQLFKKLSMTRKEREHLEIIEAYLRYIRSKALFLEHDQTNSAIFKLRKEHIRHQKHKKTGGQQRETNN